MVTDVYNTGKGYAFVTFDREEDSKMAIQVNNTVDTTAVRVSEHDYLAIFDAKVGKQILLSRQIPNQKILRLISLSRKFLGLYVGKGQICKLLNVSDSSALFWPVHGIIGSANP
jgi:hypothetical protein